MRQTQFTLNYPYSFVIQNEEAETAFETVLTQAIDDVFSALGEANKQAIYRHLKANFGINENEIPIKIEDFVEAIKQIFGSASKLIEIKIIERLHAKYENFSYASKKDELDLVEFVYSFRDCLV